MFNFFKKGLEKTIDAIGLVKQKEGELDKDTLEEILLEADVDYECVEEILEKLPHKFVKKEELYDAIISYFDYYPAPVIDEHPYVELILGVNGAGKTTSIAKLAYLYKQDHKRVMLGAADTFRAGAVEQLKQWAKIIDVPIVATAQGHDPAAVAYDSISSAIAKDCTNVLIDTAGRLQNQKNLAMELDKIIRICNKAMDGAPHRKIIVLDATQGNNSVIQAREFNKITKIDGIIITKLDGTPKGGALISIARNLGIPFLYIGVGEKMEDLVRFDQEEFVKTLVDGIFS